MGVDPMKALQQIKGIGNILAQRLVAAGIDSYAKVVQAGEAGLGAVTGIQARLIPSILAQAAVMAEELDEDVRERPGPGEKAVDAVGETKKAKSNQKLVRLQQASARVRERVQTLLAEVLAKKTDLSEQDRGKLLQKETGKILKSLARVEAKMSGRAKKAKQCLGKTEARLDALHGAGPNKLARGLKKARRPLKRLLG